MKCGLARDQGHVLAIYELDFSPDLLFHLRLMGVLGAKRGQWFHGRFGLYRLRGLDLLPIL